MGLAESAPIRHSIAHPDETTERPKRDNVARTNTTTKWPERHSVRKLPAAAGAARSFRAGTIRWSAEYLGFQCTLSKVSKVNERSSCHHNTGPQTDQRPTVQLSALARVRFRPGVGQHGSRLPVCFKTETPFRPHARSLPRIKGILCRYRQHGA